MTQEYYSLEQFERKFRVQSNPLGDSLIRFWEEIIEEMKSAGKIGNAAVNTETKSSMLKFAKATDLKFGDISVEFLEKYEVYLRSRGGTDGGIGVKMRALRAIFNRAIKREIISDKTYPFKNYKVSKLKSKGIKKALEP